MKKRYAVAFFPWLKIKRTIKIGKYRLISFKALKRKKFSEKSKILNQLNSIFQQYIDNLISYVEQNKTIENPIIVIKDYDFSTFNNQEDNDLFHFVNLITYAAICINEYGKNSTYDRRYFNSTIFELIIQNFRLDRKDMAFRPRRRFYNDVQIGLRKNFMFVIPIYASEDDILQYDKPMLKSLMKVLSSYKNNKKSLRLLIALDWFFKAHTDSNIIGDRNDVMMMATAYEVLLDIGKIGKKKLTLMDKIQQEFGNFKNLKHTFYQKTAGGNKGMREHRSWKEFWMCRFYEERNKVAHSMRIPDLKWKWNKYYTHLTIADIIFDLLVRLYISKEGLYKLSRYDRQKCNVLDKFLSDDCVSISCVIREHLNGLQDKKMLKHIKQLMNNNNQ